MATWILIAVIVVLILLGLILAVSVKKNKGKRRKENYYAIFMMGAIWVPFGIIMMFMDSDSFIGQLFFILGWIYFVRGIIHKDEWDKKKGPYLIENKKLRWAVILILGLLFLSAIIIYSIVNKRII